MPQFQKKKEKKIRVAAKKEEIREKGLQKEKLLVNDKTEIFFLKWVHILVGSSQLTTSIWTHFDKNQKKIIFKCRLVLPLNGFFRKRFFVNPFFSFSSTFLARGFFLMNMKPKKQIHRKISRSHIV